MYQYRIRIKNRLLQKLYRPRRRSTRFLTADALQALEEIDRRIEEAVTPFLDDFFGVDASLGKKR